MAWTKTVTTKHTCNNGYGPVFGRKTPGCPRCDELLAGAEPIKWQNQSNLNIKAELNYLRSQRCEGHTPQPNPGGYCMACGKGRDNS